MEYLPSVTQAFAKNNHSIYVYFTDGSVRLYDASHLIEKGGVFAPLADEDIFRNTITVMSGAVAWDIEGNRDATKCIDLDPVTTYENSTPVTDPLQTVA